MEFSTRYSVPFLLLASIITLFFPAVLAFFLLSGAATGQEGIERFYFFLCVFTVLTSIFFCNDFKKITFNKENLQVNYLLFKKDQIIYYQQIKGFHTSRRGVTLILLNQKEIVMPWLVFTNHDGFVEELKNKNISIIDIHHS